MEKNLVIIRGIPGSGKNTFAELIGRAICCADDYHTDRKGNYNWKSENIGKAHAWCQRKCEKFLKREITPTIVANTSTTDRELKPYLDLGKKYGYRVFTVIVENLHGGVNIHEVPEETIQKMKDRFTVHL